MLCQHGERQVVSGNAVRAADHKMPGFLDKRTSGCDEVIAKLCEIEQVLESECTAPGQNGSASTVAGTDFAVDLGLSVTARRVVLHPGHQVDVQKVMTLNRVYAAESALLEEVESFSVYLMLEFDIDEREHSTGEDSTAGPVSIKQKPSESAGFTEEETAIAYKGFSAMIQE